MPKHYAHLNWESNLIDYQVYNIFLILFLEISLCQELLLIQIAELQMPIGILASGLAYVIPYPSARRDFCIQANRRWHNLIPDWNRQHHHPALFYHIDSTWFHSFRPPFWITSLILFCFEMPFDTWQTSRFQAIHAFCSPDLQSVHPDHTSKDSAFYSEVSDFMSKKKGTGPKKSMDPQNKSSRRKSYQDKRRN